VSNVRTQRASSPDNGGDEYNPIVHIRETD
jgi:hypothetical protein